MKKLTAGILTVMLGIVAANSADASIASKGYVDAQVGAKVSTSDFETFKGTNTTAIEAAKKAGTDATTALNEYKESNATALAAKADSATMTTELAKKQNKLVSTDNVVINADNTITLKGIATDTGLADLQKTVGEHTATLGTLNGGADTTGSVANSIANALKDYTTTANMNNALEAKADKTTIGIVPEGKTVVKMIEEAKTAVSGDTTALAGRVDTIEKSAAYTSGITAADVTQITTNKTGVAENKAAVAAVVDDLAKNYTKTADLGTLAKAAPGACAEPTKKCALVFDGTAYTWEVIERDAAEIK